jgi:hypothetical protein
MNVICTTSLAIAEWLARLRSDQIRSRVGSYGEH